MHPPSPDATLTDRLRLTSSSMASAEARVARVLFRTGMVAGLDTVANLAHRAGVSGPTVLRFVSKLGLPSFPEFQRAIREELEARHSSPLTLFDRSGPPSDSPIIDHCRDTFSLAMNDTFARVSSADFDAAVELLSDSSRPVVTDGGRYTRLISDMLYLHLFLMRKKVTRLRDGLQTREDRMVEINRRTILVLIDVRRYEAETVRVAEIARQRGATIILLTDPWLSPVADHARIVLSADVRSPSAFDSLVPMTALCESLIAGVTARLGEEGLARMRRIEVLRRGYEWSADRQADVPDDGAPNDDEDTET